jgi:hypothetical protein
MLRFEKPIGKLEKDVSDIKLVRGASVDIFEWAKQKEKEKKKNRS